MKVLVIGGTGTVGSNVVKGLLNKDVAVRLISRSEEKLRNLPTGVEGYIADLDIPDTLSKVFEGVDGVFLLAAVGPNETKQGLTVVSSAKDAGVKKIVYMSVFMPEGSTHIPHFRSKIPVEEAIKESGIPYTILRPNNFFQNDYWVKDALLKYEIYPHPIGSIGLNRVDVRDIAEAAVNALVTSGHEGQIYAVHGPDKLTGEDVARIYSKHLGRNIRYSGDDLDAWAAQVKGMMPDWMIRDFRIMYQFFQESGMIADTDDLEKLRKLLGRMPRYFEDFVIEVTKSWKAAMPRAA